MKDFYVYAHIRLDNYKIFYVGKGRQTRAYRTERNAHWKHIANKYGYSVIFLENNLTETQAFKREIFYINRLRKIGQCMANYTNGGEGCSGYKWTKEQKERHSRLLSRQTIAMKNGHKKRVQKLKGRTRDSHMGLKRISQKNKGIGNGRAIYNVYTPEGVFGTIKDAAEHFNCSTALIHKRINDYKLKTWYKEVK